MRSRVPLAVVVVLFLAACFVSPPSSAPSGAPSQVSPGQPDGTMTVEEFEHDLQGAVSLAEEYWAAVFKASGQQFSPIRSVIAYRSDGEVACGGDSIPRNNAAYCPAGDFIAYDVNWAVAAFRQIGDAFLFYLLGHEYAHGIQTRLRISHRFAIDHELQADCMAGAYLGDSVRNEKLTLDEGDLEEFQRGLLAVGDDPSQPWFEPESHGTAEQRTASFQAGYDKSLAACDL